MSETENKVSEETRGKIKDVSKSFLRLHKTLLEEAKADYEAKNGAIASPNQYLQLVIDDPHFAWLRKLSSLIALLDEAVSLRRPANETEAQSLLSEAKILLDFQDADEDFNNKLQTALQKNSDAMLIYNETLNQIKQGE